jgi:hypothetical protein
VDHAVAVRHACGCGTVLTTGCNPMVHDAMRAKRTHCLFAAAPQVVRLSNPHKTLAEYGVDESSVLVLSDLGPQIGYRTVFVIEYLGGWRNGRTAACAADSVPAVRWALQLQRRVGRLCPTPMPPSSVAPFRPQRCVAGPILIMLAYAARPAALYGDVAAKAPWADVALAGASASLWTDASHSCRLHLAVFGVRRANLLLSLLRRLSCLDRWPLVTHA